MPHHLGFRALAEAIAAGEIGEPEAVLMLTYTDLIKHHPHTLDLVSMLLGDPRPQWVSGRLIEAGDPFDPTPRRAPPEFDAAPTATCPRPASRSRTRT